MPDKTIYILHKNGANSHYTALKHLATKNRIVLKYREFSIIGNLFKSIFSFKLRTLKKQFINIFFLFKLMFSKNQKIVLGIAPFDSKLIRLCWLLKRHQVYYHTSWTCWDGSFHPKQKNNSKKVMQTWKLFLEKGVDHIFTVTKKSKQELLKNYDIDATKIAVVYHALDSVFFEKQTSSKRKKNSFIYLGRLIPEKGLHEILDFFSKQDHAFLTIVGDGKEKVDEIASNHKNITRLPFISNKKELIKLISEHEYLLLNSKKTSKWEELFGLVIIECMSQGTIPIATNHSGPKEIINQNNGYLCDEGKITNIISKLINKQTFNIEMSKHAMNTATFYHVDNIANFWKPILK